MGDPIGTRELDSENDGSNFSKCTCGCGRYISPRENAIKLKADGCLMNFIKARYHNWSCLIERDRTG